MSNQEAVDCVGGIKDGGEAARELIKEARSRMTYLALSSCSTLDSTLSLESCRAIVSCFVIVPHLHYGLIAFAMFTPPCMVSNVSCF